MHLEEEILKEHSKRQTERIAGWIGDDVHRFQQLMKLFLKGEYRVTQRSAWIVNSCAERYPHLLRPYLKQMIARMEEPGVHVSVRRNVVRILQFIDIPKHLLGMTATVCFKYLGSAKETIAVKAFSMTVLGRIALQNPDLKRELRLVIEQQFAYGSAGFCSRARKVLSEINNS